MVTTETETAFSVRCELRSKIQSHTNIHKHAYVHVLNVHPNVTSYAIQFL